MKLYIYGMLIVCLLVRCENQSPTEINKHLRSLIASFANRIPATKDKTITLSFRKDGDTVYLSMINDYPDLKEAQFNGSTTVNGYITCFIGDYPLPQFYTSSSNSIPAIVLKKNKEYNSEPRIFRGFKEPKEWFLVFKDTTLVRYSPKEEIDSVLLAVKSVNR